MFDKDVTQANLDVAQVRSTFSFDELRHEVTPSWKAGKGDFSLFIGAT